jgi:hypothetical protein
VAGNPLFLEQLLRNAAEGERASVPGSVQSPVQARLDRLPAMDKVALQASVLGQRFDRGALAYLLDVPAFDYWIPGSLAMLGPRIDELNRQSHYASSSAAFCRSCLCLSRGARNITVAIPPLLELELCANAKALRCSAVI